MLENRKNIVSADWLNQNLNHPDLIILDATMKHKPNGESIEPPQAFIPGALEFNFDTDICDQNSELPHMLPPIEQFENSARKLGINNQSIIVVYDAMGIFSSPRVWWMFKIMGHKKVYVLDGGLPLWMSSSFSTQANYLIPSSVGKFKVNFDGQLVVSAEQVTDSLEQPKIQIIDARSKARFNAEEPEPRVGLKGGHISGSFCLPFNELLENGQFKSTKQFKQAFDNVLSNKPERIIFSCGSGVTASVLALAADELGFDNYSVYDGSWSEWGASY